MPEAPATSASERYVPAAGRFGITALYDRSVSLTMREEAWRPAFARATMAGAPAGDVLDVGCGTGTITLGLAQAAPRARVTGLDGDPAVLTRARRRLSGRTDVALLKGRADALPFADGSFDRVICALLVHHLSPAAQRRALLEAARVLRPGGRLHVADWGRPRGALGRAGSLVLRMLDGFENTWPAGPRRTSRVAARGRVRPSRRHALSAYRLGHARAAARRALYVMTGRG